MIAQKAHDLLHTHNTMAIGIQNELGDFRAAQAVVGPSRNRRLCCGISSEFTSTFLLFEGLSQTPPPQSAAVRRLGLNPNRTR
jgi:hypothetical protein